MANWAGMGLTRPSASRESSTFPPESSRGSLPLRSPPDATDLLSPAHEDDKELGVMQPGTTSRVLFKQSFGSQWSDLDGRPAST